MDHDRVEGNWMQLKGRIKERWGALTDDELAEAEGHLDILAGKIQERYGVSKDEARKELRAMENGTA